MRHSFILTAFFLAAVISYGQNFDVTGTVIEEGTNIPLLGASIVHKGTSNGAVTDFDGNFVIKDIPNNGILVFSYIGFVTQEISITSSAPINIILSPDAQSLDEVVVVGYGTQRKKEITGAVSVISSSTIEELKPTRVEQALQGQVAGVNITSQSGSPGGASNIRIRGVSTNGDNRPLILVDGNVIEDLSVISPADIESVSVLKDATAGIYGVRAANGVILITTKTGRKQSALKFEYNAYGGFQETTRSLPALNATEYALLVNEAHANNGEPLVFPNIGPLGKGTDWQKEVFQKAPIFNNDFSMRGGTKNSTYAFGSSLLTQDGIVGGSKSNFRRYTNRLSFNTEFFERIKLSSGLIYTGTHRKALAENSLGSVLFNALNNAPTFAVRDVNGAFTLAEGLGNEVINPLAQIENTHNSTKVDKLSGHFGLNYNFLKNFNVEGRIQFNYAEVYGDSFSPVAFYGSGKVFNVDRNSINVFKNIFRDYTFDAFINYENTFVDTHNLKLTLGTSVFKTTGNFSGSTGFDIPGNDPNNASIDNASDVVDNFQSGNNTFDSRLLSYFARLQYDYKGKYLLSGVMRRDGSTKFGPENKFGYFPSGSAGWIISEEKFLADSSIINFLKIRGSYGILGSDKIGDYRFVSLLNGEGAYVIDNELVFGVALGSISNPEIKWEEQVTLDLGLDVRLLNSKMNIGFDYFNRKTTNLLVIPEVSGILGGTAPGSGAPVVNAGDIQNKGFEFQIGYGDQSDNFSYSVNYNFTTLDNEVLKVNNGTGVIQGGAFGVGQSPPSRMVEGMPIGFFYGYTTNGIFQNQAEVDAHPSQIALGANAEPGDFRFADINNDGVINEDDRSYIGDPIPDVTMGLNISIDYKAIDFQMYMFASVGNDVVRNYERNQSLTNRTTYNLDRWTGEGTSNTFPRVTTGATSNAVFSDFYVEDGSFIRAQNMQLGYSVNQEKLDNIGLDKLRIYASVSNVFTLTEYKGYDPTASSGEALGAGIDYGFYPTPRTYLLGLNLKF